MKAIFILIFFSSQLIWAQKSTTYNSDSIYEQQILLNDFDLFYETLLEVHPSIYDFIIEEDLELVRKEIRGSIGSGTDRYLLKKISNLISNIGCGHTVAIASSDWIKYVKTKSKIISLNVKLINNELFIWNQPFEDSISLRGKKIVSINEKSCKELIYDMRSTISGDGFSKALPNHKIQRSFRYYYSVCEGFSPSHEIKYENKDNSISSIVLPARTPLPKIKNTIEEFQDFEMAETGNQIKYYTLKANNKVALIDIDAFRRKKFKAFYKSVFAQINENNTTDLIIDLRDNGGGYFPHGNELLTYLINHDILFSFSRSKNKLSKNKHLKMNFFSKLTKVLFKTIPDRSKDNETRDYEIKYKPQKKNNYTGNIYVMTNNGSFSMSGYVAARLKHFTKAYFVGQETGGGEYGSNAILMYDLTLPNTNHKIILPNYFLDHKDNSSPNGNGVKPDIETVKTIEDLLEEKDIELEVILNKISELN